MCPVPRLSLAEMNSLPEDKPDGSFHTGPNSRKARVTGTGTSYAGTNKKRKGNKKTDKGKYSTFAKYCAN